MFNLADGKTSDCRESPAHDKMKKLNFGTGIDYKKGFDNADIQEGADIIFDFNKFPYPIKDNTYDYVYASCILEHLFDPEKVLMELWRICKPNATIKIIVPYYNNKSACSSFQHIRFFSDVSFTDFVDQRMYSDKKKRFEILNLDMFPTIVGKFIFWRWLREKLSLFLGGLIAGIDVEFKIIK